MELLLLQGKHFFHVELLLFQGNYLLQSSQQKNKNCDSFLNSNGYELRTNMAKALIVTQRKINFFDLNLFITIIDCLLRLLDRIIKLLININQRSCKLVVDLFS